MDKRQFLKSASAATVLAVLGVSLEACESDTVDPNSGGNNEGNNGGTGLTIDLTDSTFQSLQTAGNWVLHPNENILLVNVSGNIRAFTSVCTHSGCSRDWALASNATCTCHGSVFNTEGNVVSGPANGALTQFQVTRDGNTITIR